MQLLCDASLSLKHISTLNSGAAFLKRITKMCEYYIYFSGNMEGTAYATCRKPQFLYQALKNPQSEFYFLLKITACGIFTLSRSISSLSSRISLTLAFKNARSEFYCLLKITEFYCLLEIIEFYCLLKITEFYCLLKITEFYCLLKIT
jgi:hypothetical protein